MADDRPLLLLLDGHSLAYRAFYALPDDLATSTGQVTNAVYGFTSMLIKMLAERQPAGVVVTFDSGRDEVRTAAYPEYKAGRATAPDVFKEQLPLIEQVMDVLAVPVVKVPGVEADDIIATIADQAVDEGWTVGIVTGDRDAMQLVTDDVSVLYNVRGISDVREMTPDGVEDKYGVRPEQYVDYAALRGDNSDNLPGVPGVGEKTAAKIVAARPFSSVDDIVRVHGIGLKKLEKMRPYIVVRGERGPSATGPDSVEAPGIRVDSAGDPTPHDSIGVVDSARMMTRSDQNRPTSTTLP